MIHHLIGEAFNPVSFLALKFFSIWVHYANYALRHLDGLVISQRIPRFHVAELTVDHFFRWPLFHSAEDPWIVVTVLHLIVAPRKTNLRAQAILNLVQILLLHL